LLRINKGKSVPLYAGMTVNERLSVSDQMAVWDAAVARMATELTAEQAAYTADTKLGDPQLSSPAMRGG
jgi:hypothetical protein